MAIARPTYRRLYAVLDRAHNRFSRMVGTELAKSGVKSAQATALVYLGYHNGCQLSELADGVGCNNAAVTGLVTRMEKAGLVVRKSDQSDGRAKSVELTAEGLKARERVMDVLRGIDESLSSGFTDSEIKTIEKFLSAIADTEPVPRASHKYRQTPSTSSAEISGDEFENASKVFLARDKPKFR